MPEVFTCSYFSIPQWIADYLLSLAENKTHRGFTIAIANLLWGSFTQTGVPRNNQYFQTFYTWCPV